MPLYNNRAASPFQNATSASANALQGLAYAARMAPYSQRNTTGARLKRGLNGILASARQGQLIGEYGAKQGWWGTDFSKPSQGGQDGQPTWGGESRPLDGYPQGTPNPNSRAGVPDNAKLQPVGNNPTKPVPTDQQNDGTVEEWDPKTGTWKASPTRPNTNPNGPSQTPNGNVNPIQPTQNQNPQQPINDGQDGFFTRMWNNPGGRGAIIGAGLGLLGAALDYF